MKLYICVLINMSTTIISAEPLFFLFSRLYQVCFNSFIPTTEVPLQNRPAYQRNPSCARASITEAFGYHASFRLIRLIFTEAYFVHILKKQDSLNCFDGANKNGIAIKNPQSYSYSSRPGLCRLDIN